MKYPLKFILPIITLTLFSCNLVITDDDLYSLEKQRIENSSLVLYRFAYSSHTVGGSDYTGMTILDSSETFSKRKIDKIPADFLNGKPTKNHLAFIEMDYTPAKGDTLLQPVKIYQQKINKVPIKITKYQSTPGSSTLVRLMEYKFDSITEKKDSITLYNVEKEHGGKIFPKNPSFPKGNITIIENNKNEIIKIEINKLIITRGGIYTSESPFERIPNQPIVGIATYWFHPRDTIKTEKLSDIGLWRRVK